MKNTNEAETLKENFDAAAEKSAGMAKAFVESSAKQFEVTLNAGKAIFDTFTRQFPNAAPEKQAEHIKGRIEDTLNVTNRWFDESSKILTNLYEKQFGFVLDSYSNFMDVAFEGIKKGQGGQTSASFGDRVSLFMKNIEESSAIMKKMFTHIMDNLSDKADKGFIKEISDLMQETYDKQAEQLLKFNKSLLDSDNLKNIIGLNKETSEKLQKDLEKNLEASKRIIKSISDSYTKDAEFTTKSGKKMLNEIFAEIDVVTKNNMKFWTNWFEEVYNAEKPKVTKEKTTRNGQHA